MVVSNNRYHQTGMALVFPITSKRQKNRYLLPIMLKRPSQIILTQLLGDDMVARKAVVMDAVISDEQVAYLKEIAVKMF